MRVLAASTGTWDILECHVFPNEPDAIAQERYLMDTYGQQNQIRSFDTSVTVGGAKVTLHFVIVRKFRKDRGRTQG